MGKKLKKAKGKIKDLKAERNTLWESIFDLNAKLHTSENDCRLFKAGYELRGSTIDGLNAANLDLGGKVRALESDNRALQKELADLRALRDEETIQRNLATSRLVPPSQICPIDDCQNQANESDVIFSVRNTNDRTIAFKPCEYHAGYFGLRQENLVHGLKVNDEGKIVSVRRNQDARPVDGSPEQGS